MSSIENRYQQRILDCDYVSSIVTEKSYSTTTTTTTQSSKAGFNPGERVSAFDTAHGRYLDGTIVKRDYIAGWGFEYLIRPDDAKYPAFYSFDEDGFGIEKIP